MTSPAPISAPETALTFDEDRLRAEVAETYRRVALEPGGDFHFHRGPEYAARLLGYDAGELAELPEASTARFAGVGNPLAIGPVRAGETVLDLGCGAGMDLLLAGRRVRPGGRAIGVDMTPEMRAIAIESARRMGIDDAVEVRAGYLEEVPVPDASVDVVISNGVVNLVGDKGRVFREIARVLRPGGRLYLADVVVARPVKASARDQAALWAACVAGALAIDELHQHAAAAGLREGRIVQWFDAYRGTSAEDKVSKDLRVRGASFSAVK